MEIITLALLVGGAAALLIYSVMPRKSDSRDAVKRRLSGQRTVEESASAITKEARSRATEALVKKATPMLTRIIMPVSAEEQTQMRLKLATAGFRHRSAQTVFLASKTAFMAAGLIGGAVFAISMHYPPVWMVACAILGAGFGFLAPGLWLGMAVKGRQDKIRRGLPDVLDLLVVSVESGLALDSAIKRVGEEMAMVHPDISEEFRIATMESQMGLPRSEALENLAVRCGIDELRSLVSTISQAERFGTSVAKALRNQGEAMRTKRRQQAEERAQKTAVKLMIPLVLFIFPAMGVVLAGPAAIRLMEAFSK
ncbi:MAG: type II secretion system F family protein [Phycisphaerae bacterium]